VRLFTRTGVGWSDRYPWIVEDAARLPVKRDHWMPNAAVPTTMVTDFNALHSRVNDHNAFAYAYARCPLVH
jgi:hypothetical protein